MDPFDLDISLQEEFIQTTVAAESQRHANQNMMRQEALFPQLTTKGDGSDWWRETGVMPHINNEGKKGGGRKGGRKHPPIKISTPVPILSFGHDVLLDHITSLQKRALVGRWYFSEIDEVEMRQWLAKKWKILVGYVPTVVKLMGGCIAFTS